MRLAVARNKRQGSAASKGQVRIIGGDQRGLRLQFVDHGGDLRPSSDRLRETLFNWLQFELPGLRVLDLFAGSGVLGAEALSRGAAEAVLIEKQRDRVTDLQRQLHPLFAERIQVHCHDALRWLQQRATPFDLVFVDPPYDLGLVEPACADLESRGWLAEHAWVYVESRRQAAVPAVPAGWILHREKQAGEIHARLFRRGQEPERG
jgi:16S rRNA (guanine966-N2)-methyltransferase